MTFEEAEKAMDEGKCVRQPGNTKGWKAARETPGGTIWWLNPVTGSTLAFPITDADKARTDWEIVE